MLRCVVDLMEFGLYLYEFYLFLGLMKLALAVNLSITNNYLNLIIYICIYWITKKPLV